MHTDYLPRICPVNSTTTPLASGATFTGPWIDVQHFTTITTATLADVAGTLYMEFANTGNQANADSSLRYDIAGNTNEVHALKRTRRYFRVRYVNNGTDQTTFEISTHYGTGGILSAPKNIVLGQDADAIATRDTSFEQEIAQGLREGFTLVQKFGRNIDVDSGSVPEDVWEGGGTYTGFPLTDTETVDVFSSSANDTAAGSGARTVLIEGLDASGAVQTEVITLNGTTAVTSSNTYFRVNRVQVETSGNSNQAFNAGTITVRHTTTTANVFAVVPVGTNRSQIGCYTIPVGKTGYLKRLDVEVSRAITANVKGAIWVRRTGESPQLQRIFSLSQDDSFQKDPYGGLKYESLTDIAVRITASSANNVEVTTNFDVVLVDDP